MDNIPMKQKNNASEAVTSKAFTWNVLKL